MHIFGNNFAFLQNSEFYIFLAYKPDKLKMMKTSSSKFK